MNFRSAASSLVAHARRRVSDLLHPPPPPYKPDLTDQTFIDQISGASDQLSRAAEHADEGLWEDARRLVVDHFVNRQAPVFFCSPEHVRSLADTICQEHAPWADSLCSLVKADLEQGLRVMSRRDAPLTSSYSWSALPPGPGGDSLYSAQPHRFGFMPGLSLVNYYGVSTLDLIASLIDGWIDATNDGEEESYHSPLLVTFRVLALSWTFVFIAGLRNRGRNEYDTLLFQILKILNADAIHLADEIGDSYPNNHLLADGFIGWFCGTMYPEFPSAAKVRQSSERIFLRELERQFYDDGTNFEHSVHYHEMGCEMTVAYVLLCHRNGIEPPGNIVALLQKMLSFQAALTGPESIIMPVGDTTEDPLFPLDCNRCWAPGAMREFYRALFDSNIPAAPLEDPTVERAYWLLQGNLASPADHPKENLPTSYTRGGFYIFDDAQTGARLTFRSGPGEGQDLMAGHVHSNLLNVYLSAEGRPIIVDPGTYTYRFNLLNWPEGSPNWRQYFAGPASRNGLTTENDPCGPMLGDFRSRDLPCRVKPIRHVDTNRISWVEVEITGEGAHTAHRRGLVHLSGHYWLIYDLLPREMRTGKAWMSLQFAPSMSVAQQNGRVTVMNGKELTCTVALSEGYENAVVYTGSREPVAGWVSPRYGEIVASPQLRARVSDGQKSFGFILKVSSDEIIDTEIEAYHSGPSSIAYKISDGAATDFVLIRTVDGDGDLSAWDLTFDGDLIWLRLVDDQICSLRSCGGRRLVYKGESVDLNVNAAANSL